MHPVVSVEGGTVVASVQLSCAGCVGGGQSWIQRT